MGIRLEMKNTALSGPETKGGTFCSVDCYRFKVLDRKGVPIPIESVTSTEKEPRELDRASDLVNGSGRARWCAMTPINQVESATFVLKSPSYVGCIEMSTSGNPWRG